MALTEFLNARLDEDGVWLRDERSPVSAELRGRMLREVEAKRAILAAHGPDPIGKFGSVEQPRCLVCLTCRDGYEELWEADDWPCQTLRALAAVYSEHPDYRAEWKPLA